MFEWNDGAPATAMIQPEASAATREFVAGVKRVVVKVGSAVIAGKGRLRPKIIALLAHDVAVLQRQGYQVTMVVSGAVAAGFRALHLDAPPDEVVQRQAAASVGQHRLMATFAREFGKHRVPVAQLLMSAEDVENRRRFLSARHTLQMLIAKQVIPIINENDALSDDEQKVGDNDHLAALVTSVVSAELLIILSQVPGIYRNGSREIIPTVEIGTDVEQHITHQMSEAGVGGMGAKVSAARLASRFSVPTIITDGTHAGTLPELLAGKPIGTLFLPHDQKLTSRKRWIAVRTRSRGSVSVDDGAVQAITRRGASLLPTGIVGVDGEFPIGSRVDILDHDGQRVAVGLVSYPAAEIRRVCGHSVSEMRRVLGYQYVDAIIHRDDMVVLT
jgi:glutamate 5-kinase